MDLVKKDGKRKGISQNSNEENETKITTSVTLNVENQQKDLKTKSSNGNYQQYYGKRHAEGRGGIGMNDPRIFLLKKAWFKGKRYLDVGCNSGIFTLALAKKFTTKSTIGIDIDQTLINEAETNLKKELFQSSLSKATIMVPRSVKKSKTEDQPTEPKDSPQTKSLKNVSFVCADFVSCSNSELTEKIGHKKFEVISALSTVKWIHLSGGDESVKTFFKKVFEMLEPGGMFILEAQPWKSYSKKKRASEEAARSFSSIQLFPKMFGDYLLGEQVGFKKCLHLGKPEGVVAKGFRRDIEIYTK
mmetsp:Transcript_20533/g.30394  ORF Transcript_20533/g.30394 Transcript_20533/m.30394 type:complete len:302 (-) Transcript_20533:29-934(-)